MWWRQIIRYWRSKSRMIGSLAQSFLFLVSLGLGLRTTFQMAGQGDYLAFIAPGIMAQTILSLAVFSGVELIWDKEFGFLKETLVAPVSRTEIILGRTLGGATIATIQGIIVYFLTLIFGFHPPLKLLLPALAVMFLIALLYTAIGTLIASLMRDFHGFQLIMNFFVMPTFFLSGAFFPLENAPILIQAIAKINPLAWGIISLRYIFQASFFNPELTFAVAFLILTTTLFLFLATKAFEKIEA